MNGVLGRANPLVLVAVGLLALVASLGVRSLLTAVITTGVYVLALALMLPSRSGHPLRFATVVLGGVSVAYSTWLLGGGHLDVAATAGLRIAVLALPGVAVAPLIEPMALADQLGQRLRLPHRFVVSFAAALQRFEQLGQTWQHLSRARRSRGFGPGRGPVSRGRHAASVTFGLLVTTMREATSASIAMDARGFARARRRTWAEPAPWTATDTAVLLVGVLLAAVPYAVGLFSGA
ncbi:energy-coupling factor transport system permease protein [Saccharopolyspora kobensis]|uniref:Energy-coupling factor transport system permease protein n=2 Tax=Saccharopolyspora kobensis TaxID=146035 RepID=A0A1H5ZFE6_9PSEU|nr:energy-coupling factor transporter transmembrane component T [Saccharopolyspora kobensis]SEG35158.1 energy-coupling factor transport system permease protein [Saccharopolyspora kobensis]SFF17985.1 energy-coupling factor transport system permease protein/energy-coupling factor transport system ATP-binding protein [Saccharopolyspora kobensis]